MTINDAETAAIELLTRQLGADTAPRDDAAAPRRAELTIGEWRTEADSATAFDQAIGDTFWTVYREVRGVLTQPRPHQSDKGMRIDRVLTPKRALLDAGWTHGVIGVELKRSDERIGQPIAQALDYGRTVWTLLPGNLRVWLDWVFIWPAPKQSGALASVMAQNRLGSATPGYGGGVDFKAGEVAVAAVERDGTLRIAPGITGMKAGRR